VHQVSDAIIQSVRRDLLPEIGFVLASSISRLANKKSAIWNMSSNCNPNMCVDAVDATGSDATFNQHFALNEPFDSEDDAVFASYSKSCPTALNTF
jgi:hypothetical protein